MKTALLLVSCCLEESRTVVLEHTVQSLKEQFVDGYRSIHVFDNASTDEQALKLLRRSFETVIRSDRNVGYWTAVSCFLDALANHDTPPEYVYIIESDMIHYDVSRFQECTTVLDENPDVGSVRLHQYDVANCHLFDKDNPRPDSKRNLWQSHTNKISGEPVKLSRLTENVWSSTFLTQLPALNRFKTMLDVFETLKTMPTFSELDFQRLYWKRYQKTAILDGGMFHCDLNAYGTDSITGSWTDPTRLKQLGYQTTRQASITPSDQYTVQLL